MNELSKYLAEELIKESEKITNFVVVYSGRFQPFHKGHYATYDHLVKKFGKNNVFIGTSDKTDNQKSPFNFKEKKTIMTKMFGISPNKIVQVKNPYAPVEILKNFDESTTALITVVGEKDEMRLGGKYFLPYKGDLQFNYVDKGYVYVAPSQSNPISGTDVRNWLSNGSVEERKKMFNKIYPKFDQKIFDLIIKKLDSIKESINETSSVGFGADDGEPETGYVSDGQKRVLNGGKPEPWFKQGAYIQMDVPRGDYMRGKGKNKDTDSQFRKVYYKIKNVEVSTLKTAEKPEGVDKWKEIKPKRKNVLKKEKRYWEMNESNNIISNEEINDIANEMYEALGLAMGYPSKEQLAQKQKEREELRKKMDKQDDYYEKIGEDINLDVNIGDTVLMGKFKNKKVVVKDIGKDEHGMPTINGKKATTFRVPVEESQLNEIPMDDLQQIDKYADKQLNPFDVVITDKHFLDRLQDKRNDKPISAAELTGFFKRLAKRKKEFVEFLNKYKEIVASDNRSKINIPFMKQANKVIAKTIMRKDDFKTASPELRFETISEDIVKYLKKSLGISRENMPQIKSKDVKDYIEFLKNKGIKVLAKKINVSRVGMTQKDINIDKVIGLMSVEKQNLAKPVIISNDDYILDGHHRVVALYNLDKNYKLNTIQVDLGIKDLLKVTKEYPKVGFKSITEYVRFNTIHTYPALNHRGLGMSDDDLKDLENGEMVSNESINEGLLLEGGAYGHMAHPFDVEMNLTFGDLKNIVKKALTGDLDVAREKTDGQALAISWVNGRLVAARNKSHLKNKGEAAMTIGQVADKFANRGGLTDAYNFAMQDLSKAIGALSEPQRKKIFKDGACFMNLEVIYPTSVNVIPYNQPLLVFHGTMEYNDEGIAIGENQDAARILAGMIKQVNQHVQSKYTIQGPPMQKLPKSEDLKKLQPKYMGMISKLQNEFGLSDNQGVAEYHQAWWTDFVEKNAKNLDAQEKIGLVKRWAFYDKSFRINTIQDAKIKAWADNVDKKDHSKIAKDNLMKFEEIFLGVGANVLSFMKSVLTANPAEATKQMIDRLNKTIEDVQKLGDPKKIEKLKLELQRLEALGGFDKIVPNEGIVFVYNGNTYKLTGAFAPLNQILGLFYEK